MTRRLLAFAGIAALLAIGAAGASAAPPEGPRLTYTRWVLRPESFEILSTNPIGGAGQSIVAGSRQQLPIPLGTPAWSPDGSLVAFTGIVALPRSRGERPKVSVFVAGADGSGLRSVPGTAGGYEPVFSPDGHTLAFTRERERTRWVRKKHGGGTKVVYEGATAWLADLTTGSVRQLTPWRNGLLNQASSFSPDGSVLALSRRVGHHRPLAIALRLDGSGSAVLAANAYAPQYSPDGSQIMLLRGHRRVFRERARRGRKIVVRTVTVRVPDLFVMGSDGSGLRRLTNTPNLAESAASWDPSGQRIAYTVADVSTERGLTGLGESIVEENADGSCPKPIITDPELVFFRPVWQPGPGRGAGRIPC